MLLAEVTADRGLFLGRAFFWILVGTGGLYGLFLILYALAARIVSPKARRILTGYAIAGPLILINLVFVFCLFAAQYLTINWIYGTAASPQRVFESAFKSAGGAMAGETPENVLLGRLSSGSNPSPFMAGLTRIVWSCYGGVQWGILFFLLFAMLRDLGITSWAFIAAPYQREVKGRPWGELIRTAIARFLHIFLYTLFAGIFFLASGIGVMVVSWLTLRMIAGLMLTYLGAIQTGGTMATLLFGSFYIAMLEILGLLFLATGLLSFIASRSISLNIEKTLAQFFDLPVTTSLIPKLWPPTQGAAKLLVKVLAATIPIWLVMGFVVGPFLPLVISAPLGALLHVVALNVVLGLMKAHRDLKPLVAEAWAGRPWARVQSPESKLPDPAPASLSPPPSSLPTGGL